MAVMAGDEGKINCFCNSGKIPESFLVEKGEQKDGSYLSSYFIIMQVKCCTGVVSFLQFVNKAFCLLLSKLDVIATASPLPTTVCFRLFSCLAALTSGYFVESALKSEFVRNCG